MPADLFEQFGIDIDQDEKDQVINQQVSKRSDLIDDLGLDLSDEATHVGSGSSVDLLAEMDIEKELDKTGNKKPWYAKEFHLPKWIDEERWNNAMTDLETSVMQFVDPEKYNEKPPGLMTKFARVGTNPYMIAEGLGEIFRETPGFLGGLIGGAQELAYRVLGGDIDLEDYYDAAEKGFADAQGKINALLPEYEKKFEESSLVGEVAMAPATMCMLAGNEIADSDAVENLPGWIKPQAKGALKFAGFLGGMALQGKVMKGAKVDKIDPAEFQLTKQEIVNSAMHEMAEQRVAVEKIKVPEFKNTNDAVSFGENATPEQVAAISRLRQENQIEIDRIKNIPTEQKTQADWNAYTEVSYKGQLYREAMEANEGIHPIQVKAMREGAFDKQLEKQVLKDKVADEALAKKEVEATGDYQSLLDLEEKERTVSDIAKEAIFDRRAQLNLNSYNTNKFLGNLERNTTRAEREVIPFIIENTEVPKVLGRQDLVEIQKTKAAQLKPYAESIKIHLDEGFEKIKKHLPEMSEKYVENYITHIWDIPKAKRAEVTNWFTTQNRFLKKRYIETLQEGIEKFGLKPKELDAAELVRIHDMVSNRAIENAKFVDRIMGIKKEGISLIQRTDKAPKDWVTFDHPALRKKLFTKVKSAEEGADVARILSLPVKVHPELAKPLKVIFEDRIGGNIVNAYENINGVLKKTQLSLSLFHHLALGETGVPIMGLKKTAGIYFNPKKIYNSLVKGKYDVFTKEPVARDGVQSGLTFGATHDIPVQRIQQQLNNFATKTNNVPMLKNATKFLADANSVWDKALWSYLHDNLKLYAYEHLVSKLDPQMERADFIKQKREVAQMVNDTFGGQNWDTLMLSPRTVQMMGWGLLSPDWTISTMRQALAPLGVGKLYDAKLRKSMGRNFWLKAGLYYGIGMNLINTANRRKDMQENPQYYSDEFGKDNMADFTMLGNTVGHKTHLFLGRYEDGTERYLRWGKQFRELPELFYDDGFSPITATKKKLGAKLSPALQVGSKIFTGSSPSGFRDDDIYGKKGWDQVAGIAESLVKSPLPFAFRNLLAKDKEFHVTDLMMPSSKGMSRYKSIEYFKRAILEQDENLLRETYQETLRNNLPAYSMFNTAMSVLKAEATRDLTNGLNTIESVNSELEKVQDKKERIKLRSRLLRLRKEQKEKERGLKDLRIVLKRMQRYE